MCASHIIGNLLICNGHRVLVCVVTREIVAWSIDEFAVWIPSWLFSYLTES